MKNASARLLSACLALLSVACHDNEDLEGAARELGVVGAGDGAIGISTSLSGSYRRARAGGGRLGFSYATGDEVWTTRIVLEPQNSTRELMSFSPMLSRGDDREASSQSLESMVLEQCPGPEGSTIFRIVGMPESGWRVLYPSPVDLLTGAFESSANTCAEATRSAPKVGPFLHRTWVDGLRSWADLAEQRRSRPASGMDATMDVASREGEQACRQLLNRGDAQETIRCALSLRAWPDQPAGRAIGEVIRQGPGATIDLEAALFELADGSLPGLAEPALNAAAEENMRSTFQRYVQLAPTLERRSAFYQRDAARCMRMPSPCQPWHLLGLAVAALDDETGARCDTLRSFVSEQSDADLSRSLLRRIEGCGNEL